ncbi:MAG TPA: cobyric acid synthase, partial [Bacteroidales bacterium]|nr:cobyric acid synthase [Bacteroidales bacterium]
SLERIPEVHLYYAANPNDLENADIVIIPGSKNTIADLDYLRKAGMAQSILQVHSQGKSVYGVCGGFQMMGKEIHDPDHIEGDITMMPGLGILPVSTVITKEKTTEQCRFQFLDTSGDCAGYEIHMGESVSDNPSPLCKLSNGKEDGYFLNPKTWGTYIHGIFDNENIVNYVLQQCNKKVSARVPDYKTFKDEQFNKLAAHVRQNVNLEMILKSLTD